MEEKDEWVPYQEIEWMDPKFNKFNIDTRDFHVGYQNISTTRTDLDTLRKHSDRFFFTEEELKSLLDRFYTESGGKRKWRFFSLEGHDNWDLKYLRIERIDGSFLVCSDRNRRALTKDFLSKEINQELLH